MFSNKEITSKCAGPVLPAVILMLLGLSACRPPQPPERELEQIVVTTPTPTPVPAATPEPPMVWYTLDRISVTTDEGVVGYPAGTMVRYISEGLFFVDGYEVEISPRQVTSSIDVLNEVLSARAASRRMQQQQHLQQQQYQQQQPMNQQQMNQQNVVPQALPMQPQSAGGAGWLSSSRGSTAGRGLPVLSAEPVRQPAAIPQQMLAEAGAGLNANQTQEPEQAPQAVPQQKTEEKKETAERQYRKGDYNYTVRVTGESVEQ